MTPPPKPCCEKCEDSEMISGGINVTCQYPYCPCHTPPKTWSEAELREEFKNDLYLGMFMNGLTGGQNHEKIANWWLEKLTHARTEEREKFKERAIAAMPEESDDDSLKADGWNAYRDDAIKAIENL